MKPFPLIFFALVLHFIMFSIATHAQKSQLSAAPDTIDFYPFVDKYVNLLANDTIPEGDTIWRIWVSRPPFIVCPHDTDWNFNFTAVNWGYGGTYSGYYKIFTTSVPPDTCMANILFRIHDRSYDSLYLNNINAGFHAFGNHFLCESGGFEAPKGSGKNTIFSSVLWIGGMGGDGMPYISAEKYHFLNAPNPTWSPPDRAFWGGPIADSVNYSEYYDTIWYRIWKVSKMEIEIHKFFYYDPQYKVPPGIRDWPGNGNVALGQAEMLAPFYDSNGDHIYDPMDGDYPLIRGDEALFFIFNDDVLGQYNFWGASKMRIEVRGMAYAFNIPEDSAFNNTIFLNYKVYNRSNRTYYDTYTGIFSDLDIGYEMDDYIGCDVERSSYIGYNGKAVDGNGQANAYGAHPPAQSVTILSGPLLDPDDMDNPRFDGTGQQLCNESINGNNFGDGIPDNERYGLTAFLGLNQYYPAYMSDPYLPLTYYNLMKGIWGDNTWMIYGGNGHSSTGGYGPECDFMYPCGSDTLNWGVGTGCQPPNGPADWTEEMAGNNPGDRRGIGSMGPFTFKPGDMQEIDIAYIFARDYTGIDSTRSVSLLKQRIDVIRNAFFTNTLPNGGSFNGIGLKHDQMFSFTIYPNPAFKDITIDLHSQLIDKGTSLRLINSQGKLIRIFYIRENTSPVTLDVSGFPAGLYLVNILTQGRSYSARLIIMK